MKFKTGFGLREARKARNMAQGHWHWHSGSLAMLLSASEWLVVNHPSQRFHHGQPQSELALSTQICPISGVSVRGNQVSLDRESWQPAALITSPSSCGTVPRSFTQTNSPSSASKPPKPPMFPARRESLELNMTGCLGCASGNRQGYPSPGYYYVSPAKPVA